MEGNRQACEGQAKDLFDVVSTLRAGGFFLRSEVSIRQGSSAFHSFSLGDSAGGGQRSQCLRVEADNGAFKSHDYDEIHPSAGARSAATAC